MITKIKGGLLDDPTVNIVCHQVNCQGRMGSGIAKSIKEKWPIVYDGYTYWYENCKSCKRPMLDLTQIIWVSNAQRIANLAAQEYYGYDGKRYTAYDAFWNCLHELRAQVHPNDIIGSPKGIGCGLGGANWNIIEKMIDEVFIGYNVRIYELETEHKEDVK